MKDLDTICPPTIHREEGEFFVKVTFHMDGETYCVRAPLGDGRYHAERVHKLIVAPAIAPRPLDDMA
jgi:hypothetical protein